MRDSIAKTLAHLALTWLNYQYTVLFGFPSNKQQRSGYIRKRRLLYVCANNESNSFRPGSAIRDIIISLGLTRSRTSCQRSIQHRCFSRDASFVSREASFHKVDDWINEVCFFFGEDGWEHWPAWLLQKRCQSFISNDDLYPWRQWYRQAWFTSPFARCWWSLPYNVLAGIWRNVQDPIHDLLYAFVSWRFSQRLRWMIDDDDNGKVASRNEFCFLSTSV